MTTKKEIYKIKGLASRPVDTATPSGTPALETAHNIRFLSTGGVESVGQRAVLDVIAKSNDFEIMYCHKDGASGNYIATKGASIYYVEIVDGEIFEKSLLCSLDTGQMMQNIEICAYGTLLYITLKDKGVIVWEKSFQWYEKAYVNRDFEQIAPPSITNIDYEVYSSSSSGSGSSLPPLAVSVTLDESQTSETGRFLAKSYDYHYKEEIDKFINANYIHGTIYLILAYKLIDGTIIKHSSINMLESQTPTLHNNYSMYFNKVGSVLKFYKTVYGVKPTLTVDVPQEVIDNPLVDSLVIYSCRNSGFYEFENIYDKIDFDDENKYHTTIGGVVYTRISARSIVDEAFVKVAHTPFYKIAELDFRKEKIVQLNQTTHYNNIELKEIFQPNMSCHSLIGLKKFDYNSRIHLLGVDMKYFEGQVVSGLDTRCSAGTFVLTDSQYRRGKLIFKTRIVDRFSEGYVYTESSCITYHYEESTSFESYIVLPNMITYPDIRAKSIEVFYKNGDGEVFEVTKLEMERAAENGCAYWQNTNVDKPVCYFSFKVASQPIEFEYKENFSLISTNRIAVSEIDNGFVFDYKNIIDISSGDTVINMVNAINQNITDITFGQYPLYVFTSKGIFALEQGTGVVTYSNVVTISPQTTNSLGDCVSAPNSVLFTSEKALLSIQGVNIVNLSEQLQWYSYGEVKFVDYIKSAKIIYDQFYDEVLICNNNYEFCYVYSVLFKEFSTRDYDFSIIQKDLIVTEKGVCSIRMSENADCPKYSVMVTKGDGFGTVNRKRVRNFKIMGMFSNEAKIQFYGSNNSTNWKEIKTIIANEQQFKKALSSWRYMRFAIAANYLCVDSYEIEIESREF